uniref:Secreted protein n=1 Tax=Ixodes scapularis TaxID=6945 RepID=A0A4D5RZ57_IXOSC
MQCCRYVVFFVFFLLASIVDEACSVQCINVHRNFRKQIRNGRPSLCKKINFIVMVCPFLCSLFLVCTVICIFRLSSLAFSIVGCICAREEKSLCEVFALATQWLHWQKVVFKSLAELFLTKSSLALAL